MLILSILKGSTRNKRHLTWYGAERAVGYGFAQTLLVHLETGREKKQPGSLLMSVDSVTELVP